MHLVRTHRPSKYSWSCELPAYQASLKGNSKAVANEAQPHAAMQELGQWGSAADPDGLCIPQASCIVQVSQQSPGLLPAAVADEGWWRLQLVLSAASHDL
jgi:hypothetical protein